MPALNSNIKLSHFIAIVGGFILVVGLVSRLADKSGMVRYSAPASAPASSAAAATISATGGQVFDVPSLVGLDAKGVLGKLKVPSTPMTPDPNLPALKNGMLKTWDVTWEKGRYSLTVQYDIRTLKVVDFFIPTPDPSGATSNVNELRLIGNLVEAPTRYTLEPVPAAGRSGQFTGLKIVPK